MCPHTSILPASKLDEYSTDEAVFKSLTQLKSGYSLPDNVLSDIDPYQFPPSNLPDNMWYFLSGTKTDTENGFWRSTGDACEIYSSSAIIGLRKTLQFYKGKSPDAEKTNWIIQEYTTTDKCISKPDQDHRALYRVFLVDDSCSVQLPKSELLEKNMDDVAGPSLSVMANRSPDHPIEDYIGDFLELDDLDIPLSRTTSSGDSSCMTTSMTSEDFFDSVALMRELGDDNVDQQSQDSRIKLNLSVPAKLKQVVIQPTTLGSVDNFEGVKPCTGQTSETGPTPQNRAGDCSTSNRVNTSASSSSSSSGSSEGSEKRDRTKKRKMMKYLCFLAF